MDFGWISGGFSGGFRVDFGWISGGFSGGFRVDFGRISGGFRVDLHFCSIAPRYMMQTKRHFREFKVRLQNV